MCIYGNMAMEDSVTFNGVMMMIYFKEQYIRQLHINILVHRCMMTSFLLNNQCRYALCSMNLWKSVTQPRNEAMGKQKCKKPLLWLVLVLLMEHHLWWQGILYFQGWHTSNPSWWTCLPSSGSHGLVCLLQAVSFGSLHLFTLHKIWDFFSFLSALASNIAFIIIRCGLAESFMWWSELWR